MVKNLKSHSIKFMAALCLIPATSAFARVNFGFGISFGPRMARIAAVRNVRPVRMVPRPVRVRPAVVIRPTLRPMMPSISLNLKRHKHRHRHKKAVRRRK